MAAAAAGRAEWATHFTDWLWEFPVNERKVLKRGELGSCLVLVRCVRQGWLP
jgi:hypothetical protein